MKRKLFTKIFATVASMSIFAGVIVAPSGSFLSKLTPDTAFASFNTDNSKNPDSTGMFYIRLDNDYVKNGVSQATEAQITSVVSSKIPANGVVDIPSYVTVSGKNYNGYKFEPITVPVTEIGESAFINQKSVKSVNIPSTVKTIASDAFRDSGLTSINLPSTIKGVAFGAFCNCDGLYNVNFSCKQPPITAFIDCDNLESFNNSPILTHNPQTGEPILNSVVLDELNSVSGSYITIKRVNCIKQYAAEYIDYIVRTNTDPADSDMIKAKKLHDWLIKRTEYDKENEKGCMGNVNSLDWSPFFNKKSDGKYYSVCIGYAGAYKLLLDAAGVECYLVAGNGISANSVGHAWNVVRIAGNYYHVDTTWDDGKATIGYSNFMRSDDIINSNHNYNWNVESDGAKMTRDTRVAKYDMFMLGDVNFDDVVDDNDAYHIQRYTLNLRRFSDEQKMRADVNLDGVIDMADYLSVTYAVYRMKNSGYTKSLFEYIYIDEKMTV